MKKINKKKWYKITIFINIVMLIILGIFCIYIRVTTPSITINKEGLKTIEKVYSTIKIARVFYFLYITTLIPCVVGVGYLIFKKQKLFWLIKVDTMIYILGNSLFIFFSYKIFSFVNTTMQGIQSSNYLSLLSLVGTNFDALESNLRISSILLIVTIINNLFFLCILHLSKNARLK